MDLSKEHILEPNKKGAIKFCSILTPIIIALGVLFLFAFRGEMIEFFRLFSVRAETVGISLFWLSLVPVLIVVATFKAKNRVRLNSEGIHLSSKVSIPWTDIDRCTLQQIIGPPVMIQIHLKNGKQFIIGWQQVDFGITKLCNILNEHLDNLSDDENEMTG